MLWEAKSSLFFFLKMYSALEDLLKYVTMFEHFEATFAPLVRQGQPLLPN